MSESPKRQNMIDQDELMLDEALSFFIPDENRRRAFLSVILTQAPSKEDAVYRQNIINTFSMNPGFIDTLFETCNQLSNIKESFYEARHRNSQSIGELMKSNPLTASQNKIVLTAFTVKRVALALRTLRSNISKYDSNQVGIREITDRVISISSAIGNDNFILNLEKIASLEPESDSVEITLDIDCLGNCTTDFINVNQLHRATKSFRKRSDLFGEGQFPATFDFKKNIADTILSAEKNLSRVAVSVFAEFEELSKELLFYRAALDYIDKLRFLNTCFCFPQFSDEINLHGLYDLLLLSKPQSESAVISNNFHLKKGEGCLIFGENGSGKTVLLRSVCTALLIAYAGLPIPAEKATVFYSPMLFAVFSAPESLNTSDERLGRLENEAKAVSGIIDNAAEGGIVFFNELFQSTRYSEGAEALNNVFDWLTENHVNWIAVTHMEPLFSKKGCKKIRMQHYIAEEVWNS